jgi:predicted nucleic-acid-binding protein
LLDLTEDARFGFQSGTDVRLALERTRSKGDFPEHLISLAARREGAMKTQTFDRAVKQFAEFEVF